MLTIFIVIGVLAIIAPTVLLGFFVHPLWFLLFALLFVTLPAYLILGQKPGKGTAYMVGVLLALGLVPTILGGTLVDPWVWLLGVGAAVVALVTLTMKKA